MSETEPLRQLGGVYRRRVGDAALTTINDGYLDFPFTVLNDISASDAASLLSTAFEPSAQLHLTVNAFVLQHRGRTVLVDAGGGTACGPTTGRLAKGLADAGIGAADVDTVLLTHIHGDHYGGLTDAAGAAVFPKAEILAHEAEIGFWLDEGNETRAPEARRKSFAAARAALAPYHNRLRGFREGEVLPGVTALHLPGHTPGHSGFRIGTGGDAVLIWGDICHVPTIQARRPDVSLVFDTDPVQGVITRKRVFDMATAERLCVAGMHLHFPGFAHVVRAAEGYAMVPEIWEPAP